MKVLESFGRYRLVVVGFGVAVLVVGAGVLFSGEDDSEDLIASATTTLLSPTTTTGGATEPNSDIPALDCRTLLTLEETGTALAVMDRPADERDSFQISQSEICGETLVADESFFVRIEPGNPDDFEPGALLMGTAGVTVEDLGDGALWFGGDASDAEGTTGLLAVRKASEHGVIHFHIVLGRPDLDEPAQREVAVGLAQAALPRFPGVEAEPPEPEVVTFEDAAPDRSGISLFENLVAREEAGEWTRGEGLVATLSLIAGEAEASEVLRQTDLLDESASEVIQAAEEYLATGPDQTSRTEIARLLDHLLFTPEQLEQMSMPAPITRGAGLLASLLPMAQEEQENLCAGLGMTAPCLVEVLLPETEGVPTASYALYVSLGAGSAWTVRHGDLAKQAVLDSVLKYQTLGDMPPTTVVLQPGETRYVSSKQTGCIVYLGDYIASEGEGDFQQIVARELAFCFIGQHLFAPAQSQDNANWWVRGLANYLSGYVYPSVNFEHKNLPAALAQVELSTTLADRTYTNWVFFEHLHSALGAKGIVDMISNFPEAGDQVSALANYEGMADLFHSFERGLTDANIKDLGPGTVPYDPIAWDLPLFGPTEVSFPVPRFGVRRLHIVVPPFQYACFETTQDGEQEVMWRPGQPGVPGLWTELPTVFEGQSMVVVTTIQPGVRFRMDVTYVGDDPNCERDDQAPPPDECELNVICRASRYFFQLLED